MANERLRAALLQRGVTPEELAAKVGVDPKTIERWIGGRVPYRRHRYGVATHLGVEESYLWPTAMAQEQMADASGSEILTVYPHRWAVPRDSWGRLFDSAEEEIDVLVYAGMFLAEDGGLMSMFRSKAADGVAVRVLLGDPDSPYVSERGGEEGIHDAMAGKIRNALTLLRPLRDVDGIEFRLHATPLYNSVFRADDELLVNSHIYGIPASQAPVLHLRRVAGGSMVATYVDSFERIWSSAKPLD